VKTPPQIEQQIAELVEEVRLGQTPAASVRPEQELMADLGLDSLDYAAVLLGAERWLNIKINESGVDWGQIRTVRQLAEFLGDQQKQDG
jgi:acyl carrier protein